MKLVLRFLMVVSGTALIVIGAQSCSTSVPSKTTVVVVHGAWGGGWAFREVDSILTSNGYSVYRPTLTGLGERVHLAGPDVNLSTHIEDVSNMILFEELHDIVLLGHSYGGMVVTGVADRVPDRIRHLIYLDAFLPEHNESVMELADDAAWIEQMTRGDLVVPLWVNPGQPPPKDEPHPLHSFTESMVLKNQAARDIPGTYILTVEKGVDASSDDFAKYAERARMRGWKVLQLEADHNPQWNAVKPFSEMLMGIVKTSVQ